MANTVETQTILDDPRNLVVRVHLDSDGASGELSAVKIIDASTYSPAFTDCSLVGVQSNLIGFTAELIWDATANVHAWVCPDYEQRQDFSDFGGIPNNAGAGKTGDMLITTNGFTAAGDTGHIILRFKKNT